MQDGALELWLGTNEPHHSVPFKSHHFCPSPNETKGAQAVIILKANYYIEWNKYKMNTLQDLIFIVTLFHIVLKPQALKSK